MKTHNVISDFRVGDIVRHVSIAAYARVESIDTASKTLLIFWPTGETIPELRPEKNTSLLPSSIFQAAYVAPDSVNLIGSSTDSP